MSEIASCLLLVMSAGILALIPLYRLGARKEKPIEEQPMPEFNPADFMEERNNAYPRNHFPS